MRAAATTTTRPRWTGSVHVLGWQYWSGDGWNDENVMRLRFSVQK
jgi:hypothetical protein